jgi:hypothetical protein
VEGAAKEEMSITIHDSATTNNDKTKCKVAPNTTLREVLVEYARLRVLATLGRANNAGSLLVQVRVASPFLPFIHRLAVLQGQGTERGYSGIGAQGSVLHLLDDARFGFTILQHRQNGGPFAPLETDGLLKQRHVHPAEG